MQKEQTAGETANKVNKFTDDGELIHRPAHYPFEITCGFGFVVQTGVFTENNNGVETTFLAKDGGDTLCMENVMMFDDVHAAAETAAKVAGYPRMLEDGNCYPRVLKVRTSYIVEGVAFESIVRDFSNRESIGEVA